VNTRDPTGLPIPPVPAALTAAVIAQARKAHAAGEGPMLDLLEAGTGLDGAGLAEALGAWFGFPVLDMAALREAAADLETLPLGEALQRECLLLHQPDGGRVLVVADPFLASLAAWAESRIPVRFDWALAQRADLRAQLTHFEGTVRAMDGMRIAAGAEVEGDAHIEELSIASINEATSPVVKLVRSTLHDALLTGASDIHLESDPTGLAIKYRIDGVLEALRPVQGVETAEQVISRIKVMSELDIAERRVPQDGRFKVRMRARDIDVRVSVMPSISGEDAVLRILDKQALADEVRGLTLDKLGYAGEVLATLRRLSTEPYGMLLVTGPTGSGKTTTLYAAISEINRGVDKIITIEDPVEYHLPGVLQIPVNEKKGLTFARGLRSILRHDPDKIMVGEIRDSETARTAIQAALTGHLVFTTVHANNVFDVIGRFVHMEVDTRSFVDALNGIVAQRLLRLVCPACRTARAPDGATLKLSGIDPDEAKAFAFVAGSGCGQCRGTGYRGRRAIAELLVMNDELREMISERAPARRLKEAARAGGVRFLREAALDLVRAGETTLAEVNRVTFVE
jgi:general secretion pathway protein E